MGICYLIVIMRILYANPTKLYGVGIVRALRRREHTICCVTMPSAANGVLRRRKFDVMMIEDSEKRPAIKFLQEMKKYGTSVCIVVLCPNWDTTEIGNLLKAGADDFLLLPCSDDQLEIRLSCRPLGKQRPQILAYETLTLDRISRIMKRGDREVALTPLETSLLAYMMDRHDRIISQTTLAKQVWQCNYYANSNAIANKICIIKQKVDADGEEPLIHNIYSKGYMLGIVRRNI